MRQGRIRLARMDATRAHDFAGERPLYRGSPGTRRLRLSASSEWLYAFKPTVAETVLYVKVVLPDDACRSCGSLHALANGDEVAVSGVPHFECLKCGALRKMPSCCAASRPSG